jgi:hypothetical protein
MKGFFSRIFGGGSKPLPAPPPTAGETAIQEDPNKAEDAKKKKGFFGKIAGMFKDDKGSAPAQKPPPDNEPAAQPH